MKRLAVVVVVAACGSPPAPPPVVVPAQPPPDTGDVPIAIAVAPPPPPPPPPPPIVAKPEPPPIQPLDPELEAEAWHFQGASETHAWLSAMAMSDPQPGYSVVVDLAKGCAVESYEDEKPFDEIAELLRPIYGETYLNKAIPQEASLDARILASLHAHATGIRRLVGLASRFGMTSYGYEMLAWSKDGPDVLVRAGLLYHSRDGGKTFRAVDDHPSDRVYVTPDGKTAVYERCHEAEAVPGRPICKSWRETVSWPLDGSRPPRVLTVEGLDARNEGVSNDGHAMIWRTSATNGCLDFVNVETGATDRQVCVTDPHFAKGTKSNESQHVRFRELSAGEGYAALEWQGFTKSYLSYETAIVDMKAAKIVRVLPDWQLRALDDDGTVFASPFMEGAGDATYRFAPGKEKKLVTRTGFFARLDAKNRRAIFELGTPRQRTKLGKVACKIVRVDKL